MREYPNLQLGKVTKDATVAIPTVDNCEDTLKCVEQLRRYAPQSDVDYVVVDDGSEEEVIVKLRENQNKYGYVLKEQRQNLGVSAAINIGWHGARGRMLVNINNDVKVCSNWIKPWQKLFNENIKIGAVGAKLLYPGGQLQHCGCHKVLGGLEFPHTLGKAFENQTREVWRVTGAFFAVNHECAKELGGFSTAYATAYEDTDYCLWLRKHGWAIMYCSEVVAEHFEGKKRGASPDQKQTRHPMWMHREASSEVYFKGKWATLKNVENFNAIPK